jgi:carboxypeptidase PM20D1
MMAVLRKLVIAVAVVLASIAAVVLFRTLSWKPVQLPVGPVEQLEVNAGAVERLAGAIKLATVSREHSPDADFTAFDALLRHLETSFPQVYKTLVPETVSGHSLLFTWHGEEPALEPLLLMAHMDVVPVEPGTESAWSHAPFSGDVDQGFVWGRGTLDDKVGVMAILEAVDTLIKQGFKPRQRVLLAFGHDEELGGEFGAARIATLLKSRGIRVRYVLDEGLAVTDGIVPGVKEPAALIGIAEKGFATVELTTVVPGGHSSMPPAQTAIGIVAAAIHALESHPMPAALDGPAALLFDRLGPEMPFLTRLPLANRWIFGGLIVGRLEASPTTAALVRTTTAATIFEGGVKENVLPARARAVVNFRIKPGDTVQDVLAHVASVVRDRRVRVELFDAGSAHDPSPVSSTRSAAYTTIERTIRQVLPRAVVAPSVVLGATDARHYQGLAADVYRFQPYVLGPDDLPRIHGTNERIAVDVYQDCVRFYAQLLINESRAAR